MRILLDTHTLLWFWWDDLQLSPTAKALLLDPANEKLVSPASPWEVAIKVSLKKLEIGGPYLGLFPQQISDLPLRLPGVARTGSPHPSHFPGFSGITLAVPLALDWDFLYSLQVTQQLQQFIKENCPKINAMRVVPQHCNA